MQSATDNPAHQTLPILLLDTKNAVNQFFSDVMGMSNLDYDIYELVNLILNSLKYVDMIDDARDEVLNHFQLHTDKMEDGIEDWKKMGPAITKLHAAIRSKIDMWDIRDSSGYLPYRLSEFRNNGDVVISPEQSHYVPPVPVPKFGIDAHIEEKLLNSAPLSPDHGATGMYVLGEAND